MEHELKAWPVSFQAVLEGKKTHEVRVADRDFAVGDVLRLREYDPVAGAYTGRAVSVTVTHLTRPGEFGLPNHTPGKQVFSFGEDYEPGRPGVCCMSIRLHEEQSAYDLADLVRTMRDAQSRYFRTRSPCALDEARELEGRVDRQIAVLRSRQMRLL